VLLLWCIRWQQHVLAQSEMGQAPGECSCMARVGCDYVGPVTLTCLQGVAEGTHRREVGGVGEARSGMSGPGGECGSTW
jgi:hypothetical protein